MISAEQANNQAAARDRQAVDEVLADLDAKVQAELAKPNGSKSVEFRHVTLSPHQERMLREELRKLGFSIKENSDETGPNGQGTYWETLEW